MAALEARIQENLVNSPNVVLLDVGGTIFKTTKSTLLSVEGSNFHAMLGSGLWQPDSSHDKAYFLDLDPAIFRHVLNFLRTGQLSIDGLTMGDRGVLKTMAAYLNLNVWDNWNQWNPNALAPSISLYNDWFTIEGTKEYYSGVAFAKLPLGSIRIRIDSISRGVTIGAGPTTGPHAWSIRYSRVVSSHREARVVTIHRRPSHVDIAFNYESPISIDIEDTSEELFPAVEIRDGGKLTILTS